MIPIGFNVAAMILVGNNIGGNKVAVGKAYAHLCVRSAACWAISTIALLVLFRSSFVGVFSDNAEV
jgi:Na+-driven multidrug efflux pump